MAKLDIFKRWSIADSANLYGIKDWGAGYFDISPAGEVVVRAQAGDKTRSISLMDVVQEIDDRGMSLPVLLRVENLLDAQITHLNESFKKAIDELGYQGRYQGVFPIKVNQQAHVIEEIVRFGKRFAHGLEAGSKAELIIALSMISSRESLLICNGYKDTEFIRLGLMAIKLGYKCFFVIETPSELELILEESLKMSVRPLLGLRLKLSSQAAGHWQDSGGDNSIFGLTTNQMVAVLDKIKTAGYLDCLQLLHYHLGSQIPNIRDIRAAIRETCRYYVELVKEGAPMGYLDLGGGLAVDYDGSQTNFVHSKNYTLDEYCTDVVEVVMESLDNEEVPHPTIITESGRAVVAYSSILLFNVLDTNVWQAGPLPDKLTPESSELLENLWLVREGITLKNTQECYNDAIYYHEEIREQFKHGNINLRERALADSVFIDIIHKIAETLDRVKRIPPELVGLQDVLYDIYYGNFSVFQSLPDAWAIDQIFPLMPIHRLKEEPLRRAIIADITCDSDGKIDKFADLHDVRKTIPVHELLENEEYYLAVFLVGAYQETLGDLHNLLGDTNVVSVRIDEQGDFDFVCEVIGDSVWDILSYVEYDPNNLVAGFKEKAARALKKGLIDREEQKMILSEFEASIRGYTYYEK